MLPEGQAHEHLLEHLRAQTRWSTSETVVPVHSQLCYQHNDATSIAGATNQGNTAPHHQGKVEHPTQRNKHHRRGKTLNGSREGGRDPIPIEVVRRGHIEIGVKELRAMQCKIKISFTSVCMSSRL